MSNKNHVPIDLHLILDKFGYNEFILKDGKEGKKSERLMCCPFHAEKTPSFYANKYTYKCFSCGEKGNASTFISKKMNIPLVEAFKEYCNLAGISFNNSLKFKTENEDYYNNLSIPEKIIRSSILLEEPTEYLKKRGISKIESKSIYILQKDFVDNYQDKEVKIFKNAYIVPIYVKGNLSSIQYINPNNTKMFLRSHPLKGGYCKFFVNSYEQFFLVEGVWDALSLNQIGYNAIWGINADNLVDTAIDNYEDWVFKGNVFADNDAQGIAKGTKASNILSTQVIKSPRLEYKDVNDLLLGIGEKQLKRMIVDFLEENYLSVLNSLIKRKELKIFYNQGNDEYMALLLGKKLKHKAKINLGYQILNKLVKEKLLWIKSNKAEEVAREIGKHIAINCDLVDDVNYNPKYNFYETYKEYDETYLNMYRRSGLHGKKKLEQRNFNRLKDYLVHILDDRTGKLEYYNWFIEFLAWKWQKPDVKYEYIPIFHGKFGTGKSTIAVILRYLFGDNTNPTLKDRDFTGDFNTAFENKLFCVHDEKSSAEKRHEVYEAMKALSGSETLALNGKFTNLKSTYKNYISFIVLSNEDYPFPVLEGDRRAVVFKQNHRPDKDGDNADQEYFTKLYKVLEKECEGLAYHLSNYKLGKRLPMLKTIAREELKSISKGFVDEFIEDLASNYEDTINEINTINKSVIFPSSLHHSNRFTYNKGFLLGIDREKKQLCMSANMFTNMVNIKYKQNAKNNKHLYNMARKNRRFSYETTSDFVEYYDKKPFRVIRIDLK